jgi:diguanylate cyclase (GGDEF)-like protein/PAS domain S-box-containing protein
MFSSSIRRAGAWVVAASVLVLAQLALALFMRPSFPLTAFGDLAQCVLLLGALLSVCPIALDADRRTRLFCWLMSLGFVMWLSAQVLWTYFEVFRRQEVPNPFVGDIILFLHIVPMMAALAVQPHLRQTERSVRVGLLDFVLLLSWWLYVFLFAVIPWQYVSPNEAVYGSNFDSAYLVEHLVFLAILVLARRRSTGSWKKIYTHWLGASCLYAVISVIASVAIDYHAYYTGSLYDVPLLAAMVWFIGAGFFTRMTLHQDQSAATTAQGHAIGAARLAMMAVFSTPLMVAWAEFGPNAPGRVRNYRLLLTIVTMLVMGVLLFLKQQLLQTQLVQAQEKYRTIFEDAIVGIFQTTPDGRPLSINRALAEMHGYDAPEQFLAEVSNLGRQLFVDPSRLDELARMLAKDGVARGAEVEVYRRDRTKKWVLANLRAVHNARGEVELHEGTFEDITDRKVAEERIQFLAYYDALTGLPNRTLLQDRLTKALASARRRKGKVAVLFLDLDGFKTINDSLGHSLGDVFLQLVGDRLQKFAREQDTVARIGGDEFIMVLTSVKDIHDAAGAAERLMDTMAAEFYVQSHSLGISCSLGISIFPEHGMDSETLIKNADAAMYCAKENGRNNFQIFTEDMNAEVVERLTLGNSLRVALEKRELFLVYQPQMDIATGRITGLEALLRWQHPELGLIPPITFIPIAENSGLIVPIGEWVLRTACSQAQKWQEEGHLRVPIAVNVSAVQFRQEGFPKFIGKMLQETGLAPQYLELELTESLLLSNADVTFSVLQRLKSMGLKLTIDDFGTGYSSLSYLKQFPVSKLKIDRSFIRDVAEKPDDGAIANAIIGMAKSLNLKVIAEGVENEAQMSFLREHHCDEIQGYYFSKPLLPDEIVAKLGGDHSALVRAQASGGDSSRGA